MVLFERSAVPAICCSPPKYTPLLAYSLSWRFGAGCARTRLPLRLRALYNAEQTMLSQLLNNQNLSGVNKAYRQYYHYDYDIVIL